MIHRPNRRDFLTGAAAAVVGALTGPPLVTTAQTSSPLAGEIAIDLPGGPDTLVPAQTRSARDWSILHSIYDSVAYLTSDGELVPLAAERIDLVDDVTCEITLRTGLTFHDGSSADSTAVQRGIEHVQRSDGPAAGTFAVIERIEVVDPLTVRLRTVTPAPWLLGQLATWAVLLPPSATDDTLATSPIGTGPFRVESTVPGSTITLVRHPGYVSDSAKGDALAERVTFRFVPEVTTRVADLASGSANLIAGVSEDQRSAIEDAGGIVYSGPVLGSAFLRITTDTAPFDDPRIGRAINHAIDAEQIAQTLIDADSHRLASIFPDMRSLGFDPDLAPFAFDPDLARTLLGDAGFGDGLDARMQFVGTERSDLLEVIAAQLGEVGIGISLESTELATFNGSWKDPESAPLRFVTWRPVQDPQTLLSLMFASSGPLSRHADPEADELIAAGARQTDEAQRQATYRTLGRHFQEVPPAAFLWNLTAMYGARDLPDGWSPRPDEWVIPTREQSV